MNLLKNTATVTGMGLLAVVSGVILDGIIVAVFGLGVETDSYFVATTIPLALITILSLQASKVVQPLFIHYRNSDGVGAGWHFLQQTITWGTLIMLGTGLAGSLLAPQLVGIQTPGQPDATRVLATKLSGLYFLMPALYCPTMMMTYALMGLGNFTLPAFAKVLENLCKILCAILFFKSLGVYVLPLGMTVGIVTQGIMLYASLSAKGFTYRPVFRLHDPQIRRAMGQSGYPLIGHLSSMGVEIVQNTLASFLGVGSLSALRLATRIVDAFAGLLANGIVTAVMPMVTQSMANNDTEQMKRNITSGARLLILISIPASIWLAVMRIPLVTLLFERMRFSATDTNLVCAILLLMIPYIFLSRLFGLAELGFYGNCDTRTPLAGQLILTFLYIGGILAMTSVAGVYAFPLARSAAYFLASGFMVYLLHRRFGRFLDKDLFNDAMRICVACGVLIALLVIGRELAYQLPFSGLPQKVLVLLIPTALGLCGFIAACVRLRLLDHKAIQTALFPGKRVSATP